MHARITRFTDVTPERIEEIVKRIEAADGPPPGVDSSGLKLFVDSTQGTAVFVGFFDDEDKLRESSKVLEEMDVSETPGTRVSVDMCEVKIERDN